MVVAIFSDCAKDISVDGGYLRKVQLRHVPLKKGDTFCHGFGFWLDLSDTQDASRDK